MANVLIQIPYEGKKDIVKKYLEVLYQFHKLTDKEIQLLTEMIIIYSDLESKYGEELASKLLFDIDNKKKIRASLNNMTDPVFQNYLSNLRKKKVIVNRSIAKHFIPPIENFELIITFSGRVD